jgi:hypothetical protein
MVWVIICIAIAKIKTWSNQEEKEGILMTGTLRPVYY